MLDFKHFCIINFSIGSEIDRGFVNTEIVNDFFNPVLKGPQLKI